MFIPTAKSEAELALPAIVPSRRQAPLGEVLPMPPQVDVDAEATTPQSSPRVQADYRNVILVVGVEVWQMVRTACLQVHPNYYTEETAQLRHLVLLS